MIPYFLLHGWIDLMWALYQDEWGNWSFDTFPQQYLDVAYFKRIMILNGLIIHSIIREMLWIIEKWDIYMMYN